MPSRKPTRNVTAGYKRDAVRLIESIARATGQRNGPVFRDFAELAACALANRLPPSAALFETREARYEEIRAKYPREVFGTFGDTLGAVALETAEFGGDVLGDVYMALGIANENLGQFFTPIDVSRMIAHIQGIGAYDEARAAGRVCTISDPCIGAGSMVIAMAEVLEAHDPAYRYHVEFTGVDKDVTCAHLAFIQLALRDVPAIIHHGDSMRLKTWDTWLTPAFVRARLHAVEPLREAS